MTKEGLTALIKPYIDKNPEGIFQDGEFDLDICLGRSDSYALWFDGDTKLEIECEGTKEDAILIQTVVRELGREIIHTWSQQYSTNP